MKRVLKIIVNKFMSDFLYWYIIPCTLQCRLGISIDLFDTVSHVPLVKMFGFIESSILARVSCAVSFKRVLYSYPLTFCTSMESKDRNVFSTNI